MGVATAKLDLRRESLIAGCSNLVLIAVKLATLGVLTRVLAVGELGTYFYALSVAVLAVIPARELGEILRKRASEIDSPSDEFLGFAQVGTVLYLAACLPVFSLLSPVFVARTPLTAQTVLALGVYTAMLTQSELATRLLDAVGKPGLSMVSQTIREAVFAGGVLVLVWVGDPAPQSVLVLGAGVHLSIALGTYWVVGVVPRLPTRETLASGVAFGKWSAPTGVVRHVWEQAPTLLLGLVLGGSAIAVFETAKRVTMLGAYLVTCITDPLLVKVSAMDSAGEDVLSHVELALDYSPSVALAVLFALAPIASETMSLTAGTPYSSAGFVLVGVALARVLWSLKQPVVTALLAAGHPRYVFVLSTAVLGIGGPALLLGATYGGIAGVVLVLLLLELSGVVLAQSGAYAVFGRTVRPRTLHLQLVTATLAGLFVAVASQRVDVTSVPILVAVLGTAVLLHFGTFAAVNQRFRTGSVRTVREAVRVLAAVSPTR